MLNSPKLSQALQKLRKSLKQFPRDASVAEVHNLRTRTRRVESILQALGMDSAANEKKLLAGLQAIRRPAGKVRDMDVLTSYVVGLGIDDDPDCVVRLVHHLGVKRYGSARKLHSAVRKNADKLRLRLKQSRRKLDAAVRGFEKTRAALERKHRSQAERGPLHAMSVALRLSEELARVPRLGANNLHAYRLEVKRLRYVLEMADTEGEKQKPFIQELKLVQDKIGEWHDWVELSKIARKVLLHDRGCELVEKIDHAARQKFGEALRVTQQMRQRYLARARGAGNHRTKSAPLFGPVLVATSEIAA